MNKVLSGRGNGCFRVDILDIRYRPISEQHKNSLNVHRSLNGFFMEYEYRTETASAKDIQNGQRQPAGVFQQRLYKPVSLGVSVPLRNGQTAKRSAQHVR
jgi:hypothetical protein